MSVNVTEAANLSVSDAISMNKCNIIALRNLLTRVRDIDTQLSGPTPSRCEDEEKTKEPVCLLEDLLLQGRMADHLIADIARHVTTIENFLGLDYHPVKETAADNLAA